MKTSFQYWVRLGFMTLGSLVVMSLVVLVWFSYQQTQNYLHPARQVVSEELLNAQGVYPQHVTLTTEDNVKLAAWYTPPQNGVVILVAHGYGDRRSEEYFFSRPVGSQIGAIVSPQSQPIPSREALELKVQDLENHPDSITMPDHWGGYRLIPNLLEFWQGRPNRLHDRIQYHLENDLWTIQRLAP